jgi:threonine dehydrogenase-like Zn-dependent dehydrogenase
MKALIWRSRGTVVTDEVPDPELLYPTDAVVRVTSTAICGSDLHLYDVLGPFLSPGDVLGHEAMGVVERVGSEVTSVHEGDRVVVPFVIACGHCYMCRRGLSTQCETTQNHAHGTGATLFGYTELYGGVPGGQAELVRVPLADNNLLRVGDGYADERYLFLSDILPTAWQAVQYANLPEDGVVGVLGLGPVGQFVTRVAAHLGHRVIGVDPVPERRAMAERHGAQTFDLSPGLLDELRQATDGRGPHSVVDAVGMEAHGNPGIAFSQAMVDAMPGPIARKLMTTVGLDRLAALHFAFDAVQRGGTVSAAGVYAGVADPMPMMTFFDKQLTLRAGQCNVQHWWPELMPLVEDASDPLGIDDLVTHTAPLEDAPHMYDVFKKKQDGCIKVVLKP